MRFYLVVAIAALLAVRERGSARWVSTCDRLLDSRVAPFAVGLFWAVVIAITWGTLNPQAVFHDEVSYLFQAKLFVEGRWWAPSPPLADMWAQAHLLVGPVMASKYPPGHAMLLAIGALFGAPGVIVFGLAMLRGAMVFVLARRLANGAIALATSIFLLHGDALRWGASFFSETTTGALVLVAWYALLRWHRDGGTRWIALVALTLGWCAITRPVTALAFALPIGAVVLRDVWQRRAWKDIGIALAIGTTIVAILPLWSAKTTGDWKLWPATLYTRDYMPYDYPHFGVVSARPRRELPFDLAMISPSLMEEERLHTVARAPGIAMERMNALGTATWWTPVGEAVLALAGLAAIPAAAWVGVATVATLFLSYLAHPTWASWTIYYMEIAPVLVFLTVCGLAQLFRRLSRAYGDQGEWRRVPRATGPLLLASVIYILWLMPPDMARWRDAYRNTNGYRQEFADAAQRVPGPAVLFVRTAPWHSPHLSLVTNGPDWEHAPVWIVADRGEARNAALLRLAPGRNGYFFDEARSMIGTYAPVAPR